MNWTRNQNVAWEELDGGALLVDARSGARWKLNAAASAVWKLCDGTRTPADLALALQHSKASIAAFSQQFTRMGLLTPSAGGITLHQSPLNSPFHFAPLGLGTGPRRRPTPRGNSGPG